MSESGGRDEEFQKVIEDLGRRTVDLALSEDRVRIQKSVLEAVLESVGEGIVAADESGNFLVYNSAARRIIGLGPSDVGPGGWSEHYGVFQEDTVTPCEADQLPLVRAMKGESVDDEVLFLEPRDGRPGVWLTVSGRPLRAAGPEGQLLGGIVTFRDITGKKRREEAMRQHSEELARINADLEMFASIVSHDLREPMRMISSFLELLSGELGEDGLSEKATTYLGYARDGALRMQNLIRDLVGYCCLGSSEATFKAVDLDVLVQDVALDLSRMLQESEGTLSAGPLPRVRGDAALLSLLLRNLVENALKYRGEEPPRVRVEGRRIGRNCELSVCDNGIGIAPRQFDRIFQVFQRLHPVGEYEGTGIGLAVVKKIAEIHGGRVWVESELARGSTFRVSLPLAPE